MDFALYIPVSNTALDLERAADVIDSVSKFSNGLRWVIILDDSLEERPSVRQLHSSPSWELIVLKNPRRGAGDGHTGGLCVADFTAFRYVTQETDAEFILKLDTDSLVISRFEEQIEQALSDFEQVGLLGVIGDSFGDNRTYNLIDQGRRVFETILRLPNDFAAAWASERDTLIQLGVLDRSNFESHKKIKPLIERAIANGHALGEYCQGGGYVVSRELLRRIAAEPLFADPVFMQDLFFGEDVIVSLACAALDLKMYDLSRQGEPFAIHPFCLPFSCEEIIRLGRSVVHSIKGSAEAQYRRYFRERRTCMKAAVG
jgi:hypothetical protein